MQAIYNFYIGVHVLMFPLFKIKAERNGRQTLKVDHLRRRLRSSFGYTFLHQTLLIPKSPMLISVASELAQC
uniref:Uncharacterized protein n=1 Tax=Daphnia galeata TaxID=27404 RepID=A0A8J2WM79_9CRUS|nr:unnamed protein product [Daphnia galeata]